RQAWALVGVIGGGNASCSEDVREHENHDTGGQAVARREFITVDGVRFSVSAYSEWREGFPISGFQVEVVDGVMLHMKDDVQSWNPGDRVIIASTDFSMYQAEEFSLLPCPECNKYQVKIQGKPQFTHVGEIIDAIDMRAEVGVLTRNILIHGEMENSCYGNNWCQFFSYDTFGGHIKILGNFTSVHLSHIELKNMGQQVKGSYPVHFHLCGDVDERGGYRTPTYLEGLAIHHSFSRCVAVHATNGLLIKDSVGYDTLGHCFFLEDGTEQRNTLYHNLGLVTKPGTLLPTDRNDTMCTSIRNKVYGNYIPVPATDCKAVSTFWISHPNNNLISNAAAGSQAGLFIDKGVKTTNASAADPREYLCLDNNARFRPHVDADPKKPRAVALIDSLISFKNNDLGAWVRGGDILIKNSGFADNGIGLSFARTFPIRGFQIYDGPVHLTKSTFKHFIPTSDRYTSAVGFFLKNPWQLTPRNNISSVKFETSVSLKVFFGISGPWFEENELDGDKNSIFHDVDGSVTGYKDAYVGRMDNFLIRHPDCINVTKWNGVICSGRYSQVIQTLNCGCWSGSFYTGNKHIKARERLLLIFLNAKHSRDGHSYCSTQGCERVKITATIKSKDTSNCMTKAYPKYSKPPKAIIAMPPRTTTQCSNCGAAKMVFTSDPHKTYLQAQIKSLSKEEIQQGDNASFITVGDIILHCFGDIEDYMCEILCTMHLVFFLFIRSIVLLSTRNKQSGFGSISQYLVSLGIAKAADLQIKESFAFFGFQGGVNTSWAKLFTAPAGKKLGLLEKYIPLELEEYGCTKADTPWRKDVELLKKALSKH
ncbi:UNVERIFIED_CONTAM: hypothetical protein FKN15_033569, partial [Acipenser sinensis]